MLCGVFPAETMLKELCCHDTCINFLGLLTNWVASNTYIYCLTVLAARGPKSKCWQGWFPRRAVREGSVPGLSSWLGDGHLLPASLHIIFPPCVSLGQISPFSKDASHIGLGPTLMTSLDFDYPCKDLVMVNVVPRSLGEGMPP